MSSLTFRVSDSGGAEASINVEVSVSSTMETLSPSAFESLVASGAVIDSKHVTGDVEINASNVTIQNCEFDGAVTFNPGSSGSKLLTSSALGFEMYGADNITIEGNHFDGKGIRANNTMWDQPSGDPPTGWVIRGNDFRNYYVADNPDVHCEALYVGYSTDGLIENNTFENNGNTAHIFFTWFGNEASPPDSNPRNICVRGNTFGATWQAYYDINIRDEIDPVASNIKVDPNSNHFTNGVDDQRVLAAC